ncbi:GYDIA family GHMP kinase [Bacteroidales bacterium]
MTVFSAQTFASNGKLLLTGEYLVLKGAKALALPLKLQQTLRVSGEEAYGHALLNWQAFAPTAPWMKILFELPSLDIIYANHPQAASKLHVILLTLQQMNPHLFDGSLSWEVKTRLDFEPEWGFGTSSTLIANLAKWAGVDPYELLRFSIGGSGYDLACASASSPIFYETKTLRPTVVRAGFKPPFAEQLFFVYRGQKKDSLQDVRNFTHRYENSSLSDEVGRISQISEEAARTESYATFCTLMDEHEQLISRLIGVKPLKERFPDFNGHLKNLGAWGGDFMLAMSDQGEGYLRRYFADCGLKLIFPYHDIIR